MLFHLCCLDDRDMETAIRPKCICCHAHIDAMRHELTDFFKGIGLGLGNTQLEMAVAGGRSNIAKLTGWRHTTVGR